VKQRSRRTDGLEALPGPAIRFVVVVISAGLLGLLVAATGVASDGVGPLGVFLLLTALLAAAELKPFEFQAGRERGSFFLSTVFTFAILLVCGTPAAVVAQAFGAVVGLIRRRPAPWKAAFNVAQYTLSAGAAGFVVEILGGHSQLPGLFASRQIPALAGAALAYFLVNNLLVDTAMALAQRRRPGRRELQLGLDGLVTLSMASITPMLLIVMERNPALVVLFLVPMAALFSGARATLARDEVEARFSALVQNATDLTWIVRPEGTILYQSPSASSAIGRDGIGTDAGAGAGTGGERLPDLVHPADQDAVAATIKEMLLMPERPRTSEFRILHDGSVRHYEASWTNQIHQTGVGGIVINARDITERKGLETQLAHEAFHDPLTGLANRALLRDRTTHALRRASRTRRPAALIFMDLDEFKAANDSLGHAAGDRLLAVVGRRLRSMLRDGDTIARLGGDEFAVLLDDASRTQAMRVAESLRAALVPGIEFEGRELFVTASIGVAVADTFDESPDNLIRNADVAMYVAKALGKNRIELFEDSMLERTIERLDLGSDLAHAVEREELFLEYQPILDLRSGRVVGAEALVRWNHPKRGRLDPGSFIDVAERTGRILDLGRWVVRNACREAASWPKDTTVSINVSARQMHDPGLVDEVRAALQTTGLAPERLILEITESVAMGEGEEITARMRALKDLGVLIAIDDFGTGYSSLASLQRMPVDVLKIDRSFVEDLASRPERQVLVGLILEMARALNLKAVAEGIETPAQRALLFELDCQFGQGFLFAKPVPAAILLDLPEAMPA